MFPSVVPRKKKRGRQPPPYGIVRCVLCYRKLRFNLVEQKHYCVCGWKE